MPALSIAKSRPHNHGLYAQDFPLEPRIISLSDVREGVFLKGVCKHGVCMHTYGLIHIHMEVCAHKCRCCTTVLKYTRTQMHKSPGADARVPINTNVYTNKGCIHNQTKRVLTQREKQYIAEHAHVLLSQENTS